MWTVVHFAYSVLVIPPLRPGIQENAHKIKWKGEDLKFSVENYYSGTTSAPPFSPSSVAVFIHLVIYLSSSFMDIYY